MLPYHHSREKYGLRMLLQDMSGSGLGQLPNTVIAAGACDVHPLSRTLARIFDLPFNASDPVDFVTLSEQILKRSPTLVDDKPASAQAGRLGSDQVALSGVSGNLHFGSENNLHVEGHSTFGTARANVCVFAGSWQFEVMLGTAGIMQIGWTTLDSQFSEQDGVGDDSASFAFDGNRMKKWSGESINYGQAWSVGDVIGCCLRDGSSLEWFRNGVSLGVAFTNIPCGPGIAYFPAVTLSYRERCRVNFGATAFVYPVEGCAPLQSPPNESLLHLSRYVTSCLERLAPLLPNVEDNQKLFPEQRCDTTSLLEMDHAVLAMASLAPFLGRVVQSEFAVGLELFPVCLRIRETNGVASLHRLMYFATLPLEEDDIIAMTQHLLRACAFKTAIISPCAPAKSGPVASLSIACVLGAVTATNHAWSRLQEFGQICEMLFCTKQPSAADLHQMVSHVWWSNCREPGLSMEAARRCNIQLIACVSGIEEQYKLLTRVLLLSGAPTSIGTDANCNSDIDQEHAVDKMPTHHCFRLWLRSLVNKNAGATRNVPPPGLSDSSVLINVYFSLLHITSTDMENPKRFASKFASKHFVERTSLYGFTHPRLGGTFDHIIKTVPIDDISISAALGTNNEQNIDAVSPLDLGDGAASEGAGGASWANAVKFSCRDASQAGREVRVRKNLDSLRCELFEICSLLFHLGVFVEFKHLFLQQQTTQENAVALERATERGLDELYVQIYRSDVVDAARASAWLQIWLLREEKCKVMFSMAITSVELMRSASQHKLLAFVPQLLLENALGLFHSLRRAKYIDLDAVETLETIEALSYPTLTQLVDDDARTKAQGIVSLTTWVAEHLMDAAVVNPDTQELLLQTCSIIVQHPSSCRALEDSPQTMTKFLPSLLATFVQPSWIPAANVFLKLWGNHGFHHFTGEPPITTGLRRAFTSCCKSNRDCASKFINAVFNHLNWTLTELGVSLRESRSRGAQQRGNNLNRKCFIMFELSVSLLRIMEGATLDAAFLFFDPSSGVDAVRLADTFAVVLSLVQSSGQSQSADTLLRVLETTASEPSSSSIQSALLPMAGCLLQLERADATGSTPGALVSSLRGSSTLDACALQEMLHALGEDFVVPTSLVALAEALALPPSPISQPRLTDDEPCSVNEDNLCPICYALECDAMLQPCGHEACRRCITRHRLESQRCFFCNADILSQADIHAPSKGKAIGPATNAATEGKRL